MLFSLPFQAQLVQARRLQTHKGRPPKKVVRVSLEVHPVHCREIPRIKGKKKDTKDGGRLQPSLFNACVRAVQAVHQATATVFYRVEQYDLAPPRYNVQMFFLEPYIWNPSYEHLQTP